jgi:predicted nucleic acid-binding protein
MLYLDASALVKLVISEPESAPLQRFIRGDRSLASSEIARVELYRAVRRDPSVSVSGADLVLSALRLVKLDEPLSRAAAELEPPTLRTLDAIHVASALQLGPDLEALVTYDMRMADAARRAGLAVASPS